MTTDYETDFQTFPTHPALVSNPHPLAPESWPRSPAQQLYNRINSSLSAFPNALQHGPQVHPMRLFLRRCNGTQSGGAAERQQPLDTATNFQETFFIIFGDFLGSSKSACVSMKRERCAERIGAERASAAILTRPSTSSPHSAPPVRRKNAWRDKHTRHLRRLLCGMTHISSHFSRCP